MNQQVYYKRDLDARNYVVNRKNGNFSCDGFLHLLILSLKYWVTVDIVRKKRLREQRKYKQKPDKKMLHFSITLSFE